jgi:molecular chaperone DnaK (HSP70)
VEYVTLNSGCFKCLKAKFVWPAYCVHTTALFQVVSTNGDTHLGGEDFDQRVMDHFIKLYKKKKGKDIRKDNRAVQKLRREVEKAKRALSASHQVRIEIESFFEGDDFSETLTRAKFEELNMVSN